MDNKSEMLAVDEAKVDPEVLTPVKEHSDTVFEVQTYPLSQLLL
jgi:hypothetical protein